MPACFGALAGKQCWILQHPAIELVVHPSNLKIYQKNGTRKNRKINIIKQN